MPSSYRLHRPLMMLTTSLALACACSFITSSDGLIGARDAEDASGHDDAIVSDSGDDGATVDDEGGALDGGPSDGASLEDAIADVRWCMAQDGASYCADFDDEVGVSVAGLFDDLLLTNGTIVFDEDAAVSPTRSLYSSTTGTGCSYAFGTVNRGGGSGTLRLAFSVLPEPTDAASGTYVAGLAIRGPDGGGACTELLYLTPASASVTWQRVGEAGTISDGFTLTRYAPSRTWSRIEIDVDPADGAPPTTRIRIDGKAASADEKLWGCHTGGANSIYVGVFCSPRGSAHYDNVRLDLP